MPSMLRFLPLCLLLTACGDDAPDPAVVTDTDIAVVDAAPDTLATEDEVTDALVDEQIADAAAVGEIVAPADVPLEAAPPTPAAPTPATPTPARDVLVDGTLTDRSEGLEGDEETYDMAAGPLADVLADAMYTVRGMNRGSLLIESGESKTSGTFTMSSADAPDRTGTWTLDGRTLRLGDAVYTITARGERTLDFSGPDGGLRLMNTAG